MSNAAWPPFKPDQLALGSPESCIAICCLWADRRRLARKLDPGLFAVIGNLYSSGGISLLVRNLLASPRLRYLVVCGADLSGSGASLVALFQHGLDGGHRIAGTQVTLDPAITAEIVAALRARVTLVDLRGTSDPSRLAERLRALPPLPPDGQPILLPETPSAVEKLPSEGSGYIVRQTAVVKAWLESLKLAIDFGDRQIDATGRTCHALVGLALTITTERPDQLFVPSWAPIARDEVDKRVGYLWSQLVPADAALLPSTGAAGMLGERGGALLAWNAGERPVGQTDRPLPGLVRLAGLVRSGSLALVGTFSEIDLWRQLLPSLLPLRSFQHRLAERAGLTTGPLHAAVEIARLYADDEPQARALVAERYPRLLAWQTDPRGVFHISISSGQIVVEHGLLDQGKTGRRYVGTSAERLYKAVINDRLVLLAEHAAYLGAELHKAEVALRLGLSYEQDSPLDLSALRLEAPPTGA